MSNIVKEIIFVSGIDATLVGMNINGYELKCSKLVPSPEDSDEISTTKRVFDLGKMFLGMERTIGQGLSYSSTDTNGIEFFLYFEKEIDNDCSSSYFETQHLINCLRLFQNSRIGFFCPLSVNSVGGCVTMPDVYHTFHSIWSLEAPDFSGQEHCSEINGFYSETYTPHYNNTITKMLYLFHDSFCMHSEELKLIQRVTILEMLIDGNAELTNRLSRTVAVFLGRDLQESREINTRMKQIYLARSKYLHDGNTDKINSKLMNDALDLSRRVIANLLYVQCDLKDLRNQLDEAGFGTNPFGIKI
ncbi:MAG: HEPN domain-containing protein [Oscillibacter sp.]